MTEIKTRRCTRCKEEKEETKENFYWIKTAERFQPRCKPCIALYYKENKERIDRGNAARRKKLSEEKKRERAEKRKQAILEKQNKMQSCLDGVEIKSPGLLNDRQFTPPPKHLGHPKMKTDLIILRVNYLKKINSTLNVEIDELVTSWNDKGFSHDECMWCGSHEKVSLDLIVKEGEVWEYAADNIGPSCSACIRERQNEA